LLRAPSNVALNTSRVGASTASLGNLIQHLTTPLVKKFPLPQYLKGAYKQERD